MGVRSPAEGPSSHGSAAGGFETRPYKLRWDGVGAGFKPARRRSGALVASATVWTALVLLVAGVAVAAEIAHHEISGRLALEGRWYYQDGAHTGQESHAGGFVVEPNLYVEDAEGRSLTVAPFFRYDAGDSRRTHFDVREAYLLLLGEIGDGEWELRLGVDRVFWGVAESRHLVDIINQTDLIEHPNEEAKLGQPMAHLTWSAEWGVLELFALTYHRERTFPGPSGRLRPGVVVDDEQVSYESAAEEWHVDMAARYSHSLGPLDLGLSVFDGTSREASLRPMVNERLELSLAPHYEQIRQFGLDAQLTIESWLLKIEAIHRAGASSPAGLGQDLEQDYAALVIGGEYTFNGIFGSDADLGLLAEWNHDGRGRNATNVFDNDAFVGARVALNDVQSTDFVVSMLADLEHSTRSLVVEFNRRLTDQWSLHAEALVILAVDEADRTHYRTRRDSFVEVSATYNF